MAHSPEANAADAELAHISARASAQIAAVISARLKFRIFLQALALCDLTLLGHVFLFKKRLSRIVSIALGGRRQLDFVHDAWNDLVALLLHRQSEGAQ